MIKRRIITILICILFVCKLLYVVHAEEPIDTETGSTEQNIGTYNIEKNENYDERNAILPVAILYVDAAGNEVLVKSGYGFFIGDTQNEVYFLTCYDTVILSMEEKNQLASEHGTDPAQVNVKIYIYIKNDVTVEGTVETGSENMNFALVKPTSNVSGCAALKICEDANVNENGTKIYSYSTSLTASPSDVFDFMKIEGVIDDWIDIDYIHYYKYHISGTLNPGFPLFNENREVIGLVNNIAVTENGFYSSIQILEITEILDTLGIVYNPEIIVDTTELEEEILKYNELEKGGYTDESLTICEEKYENACLLLESVQEGKIDFYTQGEVDVAMQELQISMDKLVQKGISVKQLIVLCIVIGTISLLIITTLVIVLLLNRKKYKLKLKNTLEEKQTAREILKMSGRITPGTIQNQLEHLPMNRSYSGVNENIAMATETTVLNENTTQMPELQEKIEHSYPTLIRLKTGESVIINKNNFILGKDSAQVDYCIRYNNGISRKHACIMKIEDEYYIQDMDTTNGTYVNEMRVNSERSVKLVDGSLIKMAEEEFEFKE